MRTRNQAPYPSLEISFSIGKYSDQTFAIVDTGFDGHLVIPSRLIGRLPNPVRTEPIRTASGQVVYTASFDGSVEIAAVPGSWPVEVIALGDEYLIGIRLLNHFRVTFDHGQRIIVEP